MDFHAEQLIKKRRTLIDYLLILVVVVITAAIWTMGLVFLRASSTLAALVVVLSGWGAFKLLQCFNVEYEYEVINSYFDIDKIMGKARRKKIISFDMNNALLCDSVSSSEFKRTEGIDKVYELSGAVNMDECIFIDLKENDKKIRVIINPNEKIKDYLRKDFQRIVKF